jgi:general secretion pathway protein A
LHIIPVPTLVDRHKTGSAASHDAADATTDVQPPIYGDFYGLRERPFDLTANPKFLYLAPRQQEALSNLRYGLTTPRGFTLLTGDAGTGKTTLVRAILGELDSSLSKYVLISNPTLRRREFYEHLVGELGLSNGASLSKTQFLSELHRDISERHAAGGVTGLIVDEAQSLPHELLEEIRLLGNIETPTAKLLNIVLAGQPELADRLNDPSLRQLKQRITLRCQLSPFSIEETASYMTGRLRIAGGSPADIFTREAVIAIHNASAGLPRTINVLCDNTLIGGFAAQLKPIPVQLVHDVCRDFDLLGREGQEPAIEGAAAVVPQPAAAEASSTPNGARKRRFFFF